MDVNTRCAGCGKSIPAPTRRELLRDNYTCCHCGRSIATRVSVGEVVESLQLARRWRVVLSVHDEVVLCVPEHQAEQAKQEALEWFATAPSWAEGLPLVGEAVISDDYGEKP